jgi:hypothetical protein
MSSPNAAGTLSQLARAAERFDCVPARPIGECSRAELAELRLCIVARAWNAGMDLAAISRELLGRSHANGAAPILTRARRAGMIDSDARKRARNG